MNDCIRIGIVSRVNYENGSVRVTYPDKDNAVSGELPCFSHCYEMPDVGEMVVVVYLSNGKSEGFAVGKYFNPSNLPVEYGEGIIHKPLGESGFFKYDEKNDTLTIKVGKVIFESNQFSIEAETLGVVTSGPQTLTGKMITLTGTEESTVIR